LGLDLTLGVDVVEAVADELGAVAFRGKPEAALAVERNALDIELLGRLAVAGHAKYIGDLGRLLRGVNGEDRRLHSVDAIVDGVEDTVLLRIANEAGERAPADRRTVDVPGDEHRIGLLAFSKLVEHHVRAGATALTEV